MRYWTDLSLVQQENAFGNVFKMAAILPLSFQGLIKKKKKKHLYSKGPRILYTCRNIPGLCQKPRTYLMQFCHILVCLRKVTKTPMFDCSIFSSGSYLTEHLAVFHPEFIVDCVREGHPRHVAIGKYFLPPHHLHLGRDGVPIQCALDIARPFCLYDSRKTPHSSPVIMTSLLCRVSAGINTCVNISDIKSDVKFGWENLISRVNPGTNPQVSLILG